MLAGTTHDVARSEDVRAVGLVLASAAEAWTRGVVDERVEDTVVPRHRPAHALAGAANGRHDARIQPSASLAFLVKAAGGRASTATHVVGRTGRGL